MFLVKKIFTESTATETAYPSKMMMSNQCASSSKPRTHCPAEGLFMGIDFVWCLAWHIYLSHIHCQILLRLNLQRGSEPKYARAHHLVGILICAGIKWAS